MSSPARRVVVVGASAAGLRCAARLVRLQPGWSVTVVEARATFSFAACGLPYVLSGDIEEPAALRRTADGSLRDEAYFHDVKGFEVRSGSRAVAVDAAARRLLVATAAGEERIPYDDLVLATGARPRRLAVQPDHPRVVSFHVPEDLAPLQRGLAGGTLGHVAVIGAGPLGCELAEAFRALWGADVTLVEAAPAPLPGMLDREVGHLVAAALRNAGVQVRLDAPVTAIHADDAGVRLCAGGAEVAADGVVVAVGVEPETALARSAGVELGSGGGILVDDRLATSVPGIWAAGDCVETPHAVTGRPVRLALGSLANRQGRTLANVLAGRADRFPPVVGAAAVKAFDCNVAAAGITREAARTAGIDARSVWVAGQDRAHYHPEAREIAVHLVYEAGTRRVLGVQVVGPGEAVKRVDVAAQLIARGATIAELGHLEHAYAPPYAPAIDPLAVAAFAAESQEDGVAACPPDADLDGALVDVRHDHEQADRPGPGNPVGLPLEALRTRVAELPDDDLVVMCERGGRSVEGLRIALGQGHTGRYLGGGLRWRRGLLWGEP